MKTRERYSSRSYAVTKSKRRKNQLMLTIVLLLVMFVSVVSGGIYSYWAGTISAPSADVDTHNVVIGEAKNVTTQISLTGSNLNDKKLVPPGRVGVSTNGSTDNVDFYDIDFNVKWQDTSGAIAASDGVTGTLSVQVTAKDTDTQENLTDKFTFTVPDATNITLNAADAIESTVTIELKEPANQAAYADIINRNVTISITHSVAINP